MSESVSAAAHDALRRSEHVSMNRVRFQEAELYDGVIISPSGPITREQWTDLRERIVRVLEAGEFEYRAEEQWKFVEVVG